MSKTTIAVLALVSLGLCIATFKTAPVVRAQNACSLTSLQGSYGLAIDGFFYDVDGFQGIYASAGVAVATAQAASPGPPP